MKNFMVKEITKCAGCCPAHKLTLLLEGVRLTGDANADQYFPTLSMYLALHTTKSSPAHNLE